MTVAHKRPAELTLSVARERQEGSCPRCGGAVLERYRVLSEGGWFDVVKCADCLHCVERTPASMYGAIELLTDRL